jgi:nucleotide-binding universal stress UspA family protein
MSFMSLLVFADDSEASALRLDTAIAMAERYGAHLTACALTEQPAYYYGVGTEVAADVYMEDVERAKVIAQGVADAASARLTQSGHDGGARWATGTPGPARFRAGRRDGPEGLVGRQFRRPGPDCLDAVQGGGPRGGRCDAFHRGGRPGADLAAALARHRVPVTVDALPSAGQSVAGRLLIHAAECGADLIVMGGYGHWRLRESLFGGVTRDMVRKSEVPLLLAH